MGGESEVNHLAVEDEIDKVSNFVQTLKLFLPIPTEIRKKVCYRNTTRKRKEEKKDSSERHGIIKKDVSFHCLHKEMDNEKLLKDLKHKKRTR